MSKTWKELKDTIRGLPDERLIETANEIFDYQNTGIIAEDAYINEMAHIYEISNRDVEYHVLEELSNRYRKLILLLMKNKMSEFLNNE